MPMNKRKECSHLTNLRKFIKTSNISHVPQQQSQKPQQQEEKQQTIINHQKRHYSSQFVKNKVLQPITITPGTCSEVINPSTTTSNIKVLLMLCMIYYSKLFSYLPNFSLLIP